MSYAVLYIEKRNIFVSWLPTVSKYKKATIAINHAHAEMPEINKMTKEKVIQLQMEILSDINLYIGAISDVKRDYDRHVINKITASRLIQIFNGHIELDRRIYKLAKEAMLLPKEGK